MTGQTSSPCDINHDGVVNNTDVQLEINAALGLAACTADLDGNGRCDVIDVQRVINAALGGACNAVTSGGATPTLVQHVSQSLLSSGFSVSGNGTYTLNLPNGTQAGNALILAFTAQPIGGGCSFNGAISDDRSNTWTAGPTVKDTGNNQFAFVFYALNVAANTHTITMKNTACGSSGLTMFQPVAAEFYNVAQTAAADGSNGATGNSASVTAGSVAPTAAGDLLFQYGFRSTSQVNSGFTPGSQANINWQLLSQDTLDGDAAQYGVYNASAAINPQMSMSNAASYVSVALALKSAAAGMAAPAGIRVVKILHETFVKGSASTQTLGVPCNGANLVVAAIAGNSNWLMNSMSDSNGNSWKNTGPQVVSNADPGAQYFYAQNATCTNDMKVTANWSNTSIGHGGIFFYVISGAAASSFDVDATAGGFQNPPAANLTAAPVIQPSGAGELVIVEAPVAYNTMGGLANVAGVLFDSTTYSGESNSGPEPVDQNNGWGHVYTTSGNALSFTWTLYYPGTHEVQAWVARGSAWK